MQFKPDDPTLLDRLERVGARLKLTSIGSTQLRCAPATPGAAAIPAASTTTTTRPHQPWYALRGNRATQTPTLLRPRLDKQAAHRNHPVILPLGRDHRVILIRGCPRPTSHSSASAQPTAYDSSARHTRRLTHAATRPGTRTTRSPARNLQSRTGSANGTLGQDLADRPCVQERNSRRDRAPAPVSKQISESTPPRHSRRTTTSRARRWRLLLRGKGAVLAHRLARPLATESDD